MLEPDFKVGDRVKVVVLLMLGGRTYLGQEGVVIEVDPNKNTGNYAYSVKFGEEAGPIGTFLVSELQKVEAS